MGDGCFQEIDSGSLLLVGMHLHEAGPRVVVDGDVSDLPTGTIHGVAPIASHAVAGAHDAAELLRTYP